RQDHSRTSIERTTGNSRSRCDNTSARSPPGEPPGPVPTHSLPWFFPRGDTFVTTKFRALVGGTALAARLLLPSGATAAPELPKDTYKKVAEADIKALKESLKTLANSPDDPNIKGHHRTARSLSMLLAYYGEATGDKELRDQALKVSEELEK